MNRRKFLLQSTGASLALGLGPRVALSKSPEETLPGTAPLTVQGDLATQMVDGIRQFLLQRTSDSIAARAKFWNRDYRSAQDYSRSIAPNRERLRTIIGAVDVRAANTEPQLPVSPGSTAVIARGENFTVYAVRWNVLENMDEDSARMTAEGLLVQPHSKPLARIVVLTDADWTAEMIMGLSPGVEPEAQFARKLAENGCQLLIPTLINRDDSFSGVPEISMTNETHREWIYRMAFEVGRHVIGYEVQKVLAALDWFAKENEKENAPIGVAGYGEGGLLALYIAALDERVSAALVSGYFEPRESLWKEPIYRDVWGLVQEFGDAELASMISPRALIVEAAKGPEVAAPPPITAVHLEGACPNGTLVSPPIESVRREVDRARPFFAGLNADSQLQSIESGVGQGPPGCDAALTAFLRSLNPSSSLKSRETALKDVSLKSDPTDRLRRQFNEMVCWTQMLIRKSPARRREFWAKANSAKPGKHENEPWGRNDPPEHSEFSQWSANANNWRAATQGQRDHIWTEVIGRLPSPSLPPNVRTRQVYETPRLKGYEVMLDVWPGVFAYGILLVPKGIRKGERRPVVVCQHGLDGRAKDVADPNSDSPYYHRFAARLADEGFVTFAPQNPYFGRDHFRIIQRMGHPLKLSLFSFILGQHEQILNWLATQNFVDRDRIGFYGLSYGGKTAVRVPPLLDRYALSICSGDFNDWVWKTTNVESHYSYLLWGEYDMYEFNFANVVNYAELANLMVPRPFMVERGHYDPVAPDDRVAAEYAKVRWFYSYMGIADKTSIEFFDGPHEVHGVGTFEFLRKHLRWPKRNAEQS